MSTSYSVVCNDCKVSYWAAQSSGEGEAHFYDPEKVCVFLALHCQHDIGFVMDMIEPYDSYRQVTP